MIVNKNKIIQENGGSLISRNGASKEFKSDRGIVVSSDPEVSAKASRRRFTAEYKLGILKQADTCTEPGSLGALLVLKIQHRERRGPGRGRREIEPLPERKTL